MKNKSLIITTIVFFLLVNTTYYWEGKLGLFAIPAFILLAAVCLGLVILLMRQLYLTTREKFKKKERLIPIGLLFSVLLLTFFWPLGIIDFDKLEGKDMLVGEREGGGDCFTKLKLKDNYTFREKIICFGVSEILGTFRVVNDTIFFDNVELGRHENEFYQFAIIKPSKSDNVKILAELIRYKNLQDTVGHELWITKNELQKLKDKNRNADKVLLNVD